MAERYSRLFTLPENLYTVGSPVVIAAGTLLKDNQTGKIVAQLKLRSISNKNIKAVKVSLNLFDTAGNPIGNSVEHEYLDLDVSRDAQFGQKNPVLVAESKARSYEVAVTEVVFADKTIWTATDAQWEPLPRQKTLDAVLADTEMVKQYKITVGSNFSFYPLEEKDLWYCACGALNRENENCHTCCRSLFELQTIDLEQLAKDRDARLTQEAADAAAIVAAKKAAAEAAKKKTAKILKIAIPAVCAIVAVTLLTTKIIIPNSKYNDAITLRESKKYEEAIAAFEALEGYKDSGTKANETRKERIYDHACMLMERAKHNTEESAVLKDQVQEEVLEEWERQEAVRKSAYPGSPAVQSPDFWIPTEKEIENIGEYTAYELFVMECYGVAESAFQFLEDYADSTTMAQTARTEIEAVINSFVQRIEDAKAQSYAAAEELENNGESAKAAIAFGKLGDYQDAKERCLELWKTLPYPYETIGAGRYHTVALLNDGTVKATGHKEYGQCDTESWKDVIAISVGNTHTVGLKPDGTVIGTGSDYKGCLQIYNWTDIVFVSAGGGHTVGIKVDGSVVATGANGNGQCDVSGWKDIVAISAGDSHTVGLKADGTVVAVGSNKYGQCNVSGWTDIIAISAGNQQTIAVKSDGTVVVAGEKMNTYNNQIAISDWRDVVKVSAGWNYAVGLKSDGTVITIGFGAWSNTNAPELADIVAVSAKEHHTIGLKSDGTMVPVGNNKFGQCDVSGWKDIKLPN